MLSRSVSAVKLKLGITISGSGCEDIVEFEDALEEDLKRNGEYESSSKELWLELDRTRKASVVWGSLGEDNLPVLDALNNLQLYSRLFKI